MYRLHASSVSTFKSCRRRWNWGDRNRMNLEPKLQDPRLFTGRLLHYVLEQRYKRRLTVDEAIKTFVDLESRNDTGIGLRRDELSEILDLARGMMWHYELWQSRMTKQKSVLADTAFEFVALEQKFDVPLQDNKGRTHPGLRIAGKFDGVVRRKSDDTWWLWELKTAASISDRVLRLPIDEQVSTYLLAAERLYKRPFAGVVYTTMRKKVPQMPKVLTNGNLSQTKTTQSFDSFVEYAKQHHGNNKALINELYGDYLSDLHADGNAFFDRRPVYRTADQLREIEMDLFYIGSEMQANPRLYPRSGPHCAFCPYMEPCFNMERADEILASHFRVNTSREMTEDTDV